MIILHLSGGLGNQMFQYAFGRATANRLSAELVFDLSDETLQIHNGFELNRVFDIRAREATKSDLKTVLGWMRHDIARRAVKKFGFSEILSIPYVLEPHLHFAPQMLRASDNTYLSGYWQSEKYFADAMDCVRDDFTFLSKLSGLNESLAADILDKSQTAISLHVRRGDYVHNTEINRVHGCCTQEYYQAAIEHMAGQIKSPRFYIFSDDMDWVRANLDLPFGHTFVQHNRKKSSYQDMHLMSLCKHHVIANSSFSWWGAWLNRDPKKLVVAPRKWFADERSVDDLFPQSWVVL